MPMPSLAQFKKITHNPYLFESARGPNIKNVDRALEAWWTQKHAADPIKKLKLLAAIVSACSKWMKLKRRAPKKKLTDVRRHHISRLANAALDELTSVGAPQTQIDFDRRKVKALSNPSSMRGVGLSGSYRYERKLYLESGKKVAPSATLLDTYIENARQYAELPPDDRAPKYRKFESFMKKSFQQLTEKDFRTLTTLAEEVELRWEVEYMKKRDRLQHWVVVGKKGLLEHKGQGGHVSTSFSTIWTMDEYGNLFCAEAQTSVQRNHSSFNAGKDVICGGTIGIQNGKLKMIDNASGHYKPDRMALHTAVAILDDDGVDLSETELTVREKAPDGTGGMVECKYLKEKGGAKRFLENPKAPADQVIPV